MALYLLFQTANACDEIYLGFSDECEAQDRWHELNSIDNGKSPYMTTESIALRFIDRSSWEKSKLAGETRPWLIYSPRPLVWNNWFKGHKASLHLLSDSKLTHQELSKLHKMSMGNNLMSFWSRLKRNRPGRIRSRSTLSPPAFSVKCTWKIPLKGHDLLLDYDLRYPSGYPIIYSNLKTCSDGISYSGHVVYPQSRYVPMLIRNFLDDLNIWLAKYDEGILVESPFKTIAKFQRRFVAIHPFGDGNGRMSRYLQDALLDYLNLPIPISADLQSDILSTLPDYQEMFVKSVFDHLDLLSKCSRADSNYCKQLDYQKHIEVE